MVDEDEDNVGEKENLVELDKESNDEEREEDGDHKENEEEVDE